MREVRLCPKPKKTLKLKTLMLNCIKLALRSVNYLSCLYVCFLYVVAFSFHLYSAFSSPLTCPVVHIQHINANVPGKTNLGFPVSDGIGRLQVKIWHISYLHLVALHWHNNLNFLVFGRLYRTVTLRSFKNWVQAPLVLFIMVSGGVLMLQSNGSMIGALLGKLRNKNAWFVCPSISVNKLQFI